MSGTTGTVPLENKIPDQLITSASWNSEFSNIGKLLDAAGCGGHSDTDSDTQIQTAPYPGSVLSKAASIAGEFERIRYQLAKILGTDYWYKPAATDLTSVGNVVVPVGGVIDYPTNTAPSASWHLADGTAISRAAYPALFTLIGTTFGVGNGTTTFNLPDYRDRMSIGAGTSYVGGATGGEATHVLTTAELAAHSHGVTDPGHTHTQVAHNHGVTDPGHTHVERGSNPAALDTTSMQLSSGAAGSFDSSLSTKSATTGISVNNATPTNNSNTTGITTNNEGSGTAHNNLPPYLGMYKIIRVI